MIVFDQPWVLLGFTVFIPLVLLNHFSRRRKRIQKSLPVHLRKRIFVSRVLFGLFLACLIAAIAGPRWGLGQSAGEYRRAIDAVIAIDVSRSMEIRDSRDPEGGINGSLGGEISRLERGMAIVRKTIAALPELRYAVAISRNRGIVAIPLTWDNGAVLAFLDALDGTSLTGRGTNLEALLNSAADAFQVSHSSSRVIILVSDGEALSGSLKAALGRCNRDGIAVTTIAVGSDEGRNLPDNDEIISRRNPGTLRMAAGETGGAFIDGNRADADLALIAHLCALALETKTGEGKTERKAHWFIFAGLAIIAYSASRASLLKMRYRKAGIKNAATN